MPSLVAKTVRGRKYWQIVESRRVNGQPRSFVLAHLGRPDTLLARLQGGAGSLRCRSVAHGAVAALGRGPRRWPSPHSLMRRCVAMGGGASPSAPGSRRGSRWSSRRWPAPVGP